MSSMNCNYCRQNGHFIKSRSGQVTCPVLQSKNRRSNQYRPRRQVKPQPSNDGWSQVGKQVACIVQPKSRGFVKYESTWSALEEEKTPVDEEEKTPVDEEKTCVLQGSWVNAPRILKSENKSPAKLVEEENKLEDLKIEKKEVEDEIAEWMEKFGNKKRNELRWADSCDLSDLKERFEKLEVLLA
jgi:hypothetical protein